MNVSLQGLLTAAALGLIQAGIAATVPWLEAIKVLKADSTDNLIGVGTFAIAWGLNATFHLVRKRNTA
ncbi:MAG TPA: hypothetical protein VGF33_03025 [Caulobacteraceae bacterium]